MNDAILKFLAASGRLKSIKRKGWLQSGLPEEQVESVAEHVFRTSLIAVVAAELIKGINTGKLISLAVVHDLCEIYAGDITPGDKVSRKEKLRREKEGMMMLVRQMLSGNSAERKVGSRILKLWNEYENGKSSEAKLIRDIDIIERTLQGAEYLADSRKKRGKVRNALKRFVDDLARIETAEMQQIGRKIAKLYAGEKTKM